MLARMLPKLAPLALSQAPRIFNRRNDELIYLIVGVLIGVGVTASYRPQATQPIARETSQRIKMGEAATGNDIKPVGNED